MATQEQEKIILGRKIRELVYAVTGEVYNEEDVARLGETIHSLIGAAVKAALPGKQSEANTKAIQNAAQKAFARKLARKVNSL